MALMTDSERAIPGPAGEDVLRDFLDLAVPHGYRAELIDGEILMTPPPDGEHETLFAELARQFIREAETELDISGTKGLITPRGHFIPDGTIAPVGHFRDAESWAPTDGVLLVFEITSTNPGPDRTSKRDGYAEAGIPCYLLVDRTAGKVTLFSEPKDGVYTDQHVAAFGRSVRLPAPFSFDLKTEPFV